MRLGIRPITYNTMTKKPRTESYVRFDWAMKRLLRNKANYGVLEGFLSTLFDQKVRINRILESESNRESEYEKSNRVDLLAEMEGGQLVIIEVQNNTELTYFQRMIFGTSKLLSEYINRGDNYEKVRKVYSVNIVYFPLGMGKDYLYHGKTEFKGQHLGDILDLSPFQKQRFKVDSVSQLFPEYYILKVNEFNKVAKSPLEEWIHYLNTGEVRDDASAPGLDLVREKLRLEKMSKSELDAYYKHLDDLNILRDNITTERAEGRLEGIAEGRLKGIAEGREEGLAKGLEEGRAEGRAEGRKEGLEEGRLEGRAEGRAEGREEGRAEAIADMVRKMEAQGLDGSIIRQIIPNRSLDFG